MKNQAQSQSRMRVRLALRGAVQGVGFRPFVHRLATELSLTGWVNNSPQGVFVEAESPRPALEQFLRRLEAEKPPRSFIQSMETTWLDAVGFNQFEIRASEAGGEKIALVLPDIATCPECLREVFNPKNRRFGYPFTNCTNCGPRFSIIESLPYDRANTSMKSFAMCPACRKEYDNPQDRRFHAQPNACPVCGPRLEFSDHDRRSDFWRRRGAAGRRQRNPTRQNRRRQRHRRISFDGGRAQPKSRPTFARTKTSRGKTIRTAVSIARMCENRLRSFTTGRTAAALARSADCFAASLETSNFKSKISNYKRRCSGKSKSRRNATIQSAAPFAAISRFCSAAYWYGWSCSRRRHSRRFPRRRPIASRLPPLLRNWPCMHSTAAIRPS